MSSDPFTGPLAFDELLAEIASAMRGITQQIGNPDCAAHIAAAGAHLHAITTTTPNILSALAYWYERNAQHLMVVDRGDGDATGEAADASATLRAFGGELRDVAKRYDTAIKTLGIYEHRAMYELHDDEIDDEDEVYAIIEVDYAGAQDHALCAYSRPDVARYHARQIARHGTPGNTYRVVPIINDEREAHIAEWPGEGQTSG